MKPGRPVYHVPAKWIEFKDELNAYYYELDQKGNIEKRPSDDGKAKEIIAHHQKKIDAIYPDSPCSDPDGKKFEDDFGTLEESQYFTIQPLDADPCRNSDFCNL